MIATAAAPADSVLRSTISGLLAPRRAIPIALVVIPLAVIQDAYSRDAFAVPLALLMCASFLFVGPALWRALFPMDRPAPASWPLRVLLYAGVGASLVVGLGRAVPDLAGVGQTFLTSKPSLVVCVALFWVGGWGLARDIELERHLGRERSRAEANAREAERAQLLALKTHLDPHFLFNTLNAIAEWCREDALVAEKAIVQLSEMLRTMMTGITAEAWPLEKEIALAEALFSLHAIRDPSLVHIVRSIPSPIPKIDVPPMLILPIVENAMKHGPLARNKGSIDLSIASKNGLVVITVENPGAWKGLREGGNGLGIVKKRLVLAYGDRASLDIGAAEKPDRTRAIIVVPSTLEK